mgnify:CR=1 FL=1
MYSCYKNRNFRCNCNQANESSCFANVLVFLVDDKNWTELLIVRHTSKQFNLLPESNFRVTNLGNGNNGMNQNGNNQQRNERNSGQNNENKRNNGNPLAKCFVPASNNA